MANHRVSLGVKFLTFFPFLLSFLSPFSYSAKCLTLMNHYLASSCWTRPIYVHTRERKVSKGGWLLLIFGSFFLLHRQIFGVILLFCDEVRHSGRPTMSGNYVCKGYDICAGARTKHDQKVSLEIQLFHYTCVSYVQTPSYNILIQHQT